MSENSLRTDLLNTLIAKRTQRRRFLSTAGGLGVGLAAGTILSACGGGDGDNAVAQTPPPAATGPSDPDILNFALNLEYLEAQFYQYAITGAGLASNLLTGTGTQGQVTAGHQVPFAIPIVAQYAQEIAADELAHVAFLRTALGAAAVSQPAIDVGFGPNSAFSVAARSAGLVGPGVAFDPYLNDTNFLLGAFIFEDVGVTAYKGASPFITNKTFLEAAAGILAAEAYHAALVRTVLYALSDATPSLLLRESALAISNARDNLDASDDKDQGIDTTGTGATAASNIVPLDANGLAFSRSTGDVLNIVYLNGGAVTSGGFFPAGVNGALNTSSAFA